MGSLEVGEEKQTRQGKIGQKGAKGKPPHHTSVVVFVWMQNATHEKVKKERKLRKQKKKEVDQKKRAKKGKMQTSKHSNVSD